MKKILSIACAAMLITACGSFSGKAEPASDTAKTEQTGQQQEKAIHLTKAQFLEKVYNYEAYPDTWKYEGDKPCIIDFYASWCGPCKMIAPILEELAAEYDGQIYIYKINTEEERELAAAFGIQSIPTLLFVPVDGRPQMARGAMPKESLVEAIKTVLLPDSK